MADFKINGVTFASESGGVVSLSNANVFPSGHIIQTVYKNGTITNSEISGSTTVQNSTFFNKSITAKGNNSIFVINAFVGQSYVQDTSSNGKVALTRNLNSTLTYLSDLNAPNNWGGISVASPTHYNPQSFCWVDNNSSCSVGNTLDYVIYFVRYSNSGNSFYFIDGTNNGSYCSYVIQEIAA